MSLLVISLTPNSLEPSSKLSRWQKESRKTGSKKSTRNWKYRMMKRRHLLMAGTALALTPLRNVTPAHASPAEQKAKKGERFDSIKALTFDVFGTVVDWRSSIIREGQLLSQEKSLEVDWPKFADRWRDGYMPVMQRVREGQLPYSKIDVLHRLILDGLIKDFGLEGLSPSEVDHLNRVWHRLMPWPDSVPGLNRLRGRFVVSSLSNGNVSLLVNMAKNAGIPWDCVLSAELTGHYKPDKEVYVKAADLLGLEPSEVMMVAAHPIDLRAAAKVGYRTALVLRPLERGPDRGLYFEPDPSEFDLTVNDFWDLAKQLGA